MAHVNERQQEARRFDFCVSGGGTRAMLAGLVMLDLIDQRIRASNTGLAADVRVVPTTGLYGVSGGSWAVLLYERLGTTALDNFRDWSDPKSAWCGVPCNERETNRYAFLGGPPNTSIGSGAGLRMLFRALCGRESFAFDSWMTYVVNVLRPALGCKNTRTAVSASLGNPPNAHIVVFATPGRNSSADVVSFTAPSGQARTTCNLDRRNDTFQNASISLESQNNLDALTLAALASTAYFGGSQRVRGNVGIDASIIPVGGQPTPYELFDAGVVCNIPFTREQLMTEGTSFVVNASEDGALGATWNACVQFWGSFGFQFAQRGANIPINLCGVKKNLTPPADHYAQYVKFFDVKHDNGAGYQETGRSVIVIELGRVPGGVNRFGGISTFSMSRWFVRARIFGTDEFNIMNIQVRQFYHEALTSMGWP
jgi:hypothetical protein